MTKEPAKNRYDASGAHGGIPNDWSVRTARHAAGPALCRISSDRTCRNASESLWRNPSGQNGLCSIGKVSSFGINLTVTGWTEVNDCSLNQAVKMSSVGPNGLKY